MDPAPKGMNRHMKGMNCIFHVFLGAIPSGRRRPSGRYGQELAIRSALRTPVGALGLPPFGRHPFPALSQEAMALFENPLREDDSYLSTIALHGGMTVLPEDGLWCTSQAIQLILRLICTDGPKEAHEKHLIEIR